MSGFECTLREKDAVVGNDTDRIAHDPGEATDQRGTVQRLEFMKVAAIDEARDHFAYVVTFAAISGDDAVEFGRIVARWFWWADIPGNVLALIQVRDDTSAD